MARKPIEYKSRQRGEKKISKSGDNFSLQKKSRLNIDQLQTSLRLKKVRIFPINPIKILSLRFEKKTK